MNKKLIYITAFTLWAVLFNACQKIESAPEVAQPLINLEVDKATIQLDNQTYTTGPLKDYEQESEVVYKLTVSSPRALSKLIVTTSAEKISPLSHIVKTVPENAIDANGNFLVKTENVVVLYAFHIDAAVKPLSTIAVNFTFQNDQNYIGLSTHTFSVIKSGSTNGQPLTKIEMQFSIYNKDGIGTQDNLDLASGIKLTTGELMKNRGPFYSLESRNDISVSADAIRMSDKIDFVGYKTKAEGTDPILVNGQYYLVSPSDTIVLTSNYIGAPALPDAQSMKMRNTIRAIALKLQGEGKTLRKVYFKRLDNITGTNQVTPAGFDILTHDNEFDILLAGIADEAQTIAGPVNFNAVYGFVMDDGRKGLIRVCPPTMQVTSDVGGLVPGTNYSIPAPSTGNLLCTIKYQDN